MSVSVWAGGTCLRSVCSPLAFSVGSTAKVWVGSAADGTGIEMHADQIVRLRQPRLRVLVGDDARARLAEVAVVVGMIEVPVGVDQGLDRRPVDGVERRLQARPRRLDEAVDDDLAVGTVQDHDVAAGTGEHDEAFAELRRLDRPAAHLRAHGIGRVALEGVERSARSVAEQESAAGKDAGRVQKRAAG